MLLLVGFFSLDAIAQCSTIPRAAISSSAIFLPYTPVYICPNSFDIVTLTPVTRYRNATYLWSTGQTSIYIDAGIGRYALTVTVDTCTSTSDTIEIFASPTPVTLNYPDTLRRICQGDTLRYRFSLPINMALTPVSENANPRRFYSPDGESVVITGSGDFSIQTAFINPTVDSYCLSKSTRSLRVEVLNPDTNIKISVYKSNRTADVPYGRCVTDTFYYELRSNYPYFNQWSTGDTTRTIRVRRTGTYTLRNTTTCGFGRRTDSIRILDFSDFTPPIGPQVNSVSVFNTSCVRTNEDVMELRAYPGAGDIVTWNDGSEFSRKIIFSAGTYSYTITRNGCISRPRVFTLRDVPNITVTGTFNSLCSANDSLRLRISESNVSGTFQWYNGINPIAGATDSFYVARSAGTYSVKVAVDTNCTIQSSSFTVTSLSEFTPPVGPQVNSVTIFNTGCINISESSMQLRAHPSAGDVVTWNDGTTQAIKAITRAGTYSYTITRNGCVSRPRIFTLRDVPNITVTGTGNSLCSANDSIRLSINVQNVPGTYQWYNGSNPIAGATDSIYTAREAGTYYVKASVDTNCTIQSSLWVVSNQSNLVTPSISRNGSSFTASISDTSSITRYYFWYRNDTLVQSSTSNSYLINGNGSYKVRYALNAAGTCFSPFSSIISSTNAKYGIVQVAAFPNPTNGELTITGIAKENVSTVSIINSLGQAQTIEYTESSEGISTSLSGIAKGIYLLQIQLKDGRAAHTKIVKQ